MDNIKVCEQLFDNNADETRTFAESNLFMLENEVLCDVTFLTGSTKQEVKGHKYMLASRSPVFFAMFNGSLPEVGHVEVPDIEADILKDLFRYMYTGDCKLHYETAMALMYVAMKYQVKGLETTCKEFLKTEMTVDNVCFLLEQAREFPDEELEEICMDFIFCHSVDVLESSDFCTLSKPLMRKILESDDLSAFEIDVYKACKRWAHNACKQNDEKYDDTDELRQALGDLVYLIRFPNIPKETFSAIISKENILTSDEKVEIFQYIIDTPSVVPEGFKFNHKPRKEAVDCVLVKRFIYNSNQSYRMFRDEQHGISFKIEYGYVKLAGVTVFSPCTRGSCLTGSISIMEEDKSILLKDDVCIQHDDNKSFEEVKFDRSVRIKPNVIYSVVLNMGGCETYLGTRSREHLAKNPFNGKSIEIKFLDYPKSGPQLYDIEHTNTEQGQIHGLVVQIFGV